MRIDFLQVQVQYPYEQTALIKNATFSLTQGVNTILCDTQSGKSTICKLLCNEVCPTSGQILFDGVDVTSINDGNLATLYLPSNPAFFENRTVLYNVAYPLLVRKTPKQKAFAIAQEMLQSMQLQNYALVKVKKLSPFLRKSVAIARGLTVKRDVVLFDDLFDDADDVCAVLKQFSAPISVVVTSKASLAMGNVVVLDGGNTVFCGDSVLAKQVVSGLGWLVDSL